jgi:hypothetical protein
MDDLWLWLWRRLLDRRGRLLIRLLLNNWSYHLWNRCYFRVAFPQLGFDLTAHWRPSVPLVVVTACTVLDHMLLVFGFVLFDHK